jgi:hypothetical protein
MENKEKGKGLKFMTPSMPGLSCGQVFRMIFPENVIWYKRTEN